MVAGSTPVGGFGEVGPRSPQQTAARNRRQPAAHGSQPKPAHALPVPSPGQFTPQAAPA
jgi:hypothetical protein